MEECTSAYVASFIGAHPEGAEKVNDDDHACVHLRPAPLAAEQAKARGTGIACALSNKNAGAVWQGLTSPLTVEPRQCHAGSIPVGAACSPHGDGAGEQRRRHACTAAACVQLLTDLLQN